MRGWLSHAKSAKSAKIGAGLGASRSTTEAGKAGNRLAAIDAEPLSVSASKLASGKKAPRHPFGFPGLAGHGSGLRPTRNFTEVSPLRFEVRTGGKYQAPFRGASVPREAGFRDRRGSAYPLER